MFEKSVCPLALRKLLTYDFVFSNDAWQTPPAATDLPMASSHHLTYPRQVSARLAPPPWCCAVALLPCQTRPYRCSCNSRVSFSSHSSCTLYSSAAFEGPTCLASFQLPFLLHPLYLASSFLPCFTSSISVPPANQPFPIDLPSSLVRPPASRRLDRVESKQLIRRTILWFALSLIYSYTKWLRLPTTVSSRTQCVNHFLEEALLTNHLYQYIDTSVTQTPPYRQYLVI